MIKDIIKLNIEYVSGKNIIFKNTNLGLIEPHKIIANNNKGIVLLCYNEDTTLYKNDLSGTITINELTNIIKVLLGKNKNL